MKEALVEAVEHPLHYTSHPSGVECITVIQHMPYNVGCAMKYLWRQGLKEAGSKEKQAEDLRKAIKMIEFEIARINTSK